MQPLRALPSKSERDLLIDERDWFLRYRHSEVSAPLIISFPAFQDAAK